MATKLPRRGRIWWQGIRRGRAALTAGLLLPVMLGVGLIAGPSPAAPTRQALHGHPAAQPAGAAQVIGGHIPLMLNPAVPVLSAGSRGPHISQAPATAASGQMPIRHRAGQPRASSQRGGMGRGQCQHQSPAYRPGRVFAERADSQSGGLVAASPPGGSGAASPPGGSGAASPPGGPAAAATQPQPAAAATQPRPAAGTTPPRPAAAARRGQAAPPAAVHVSPRRPPAGRLMQGIPQTQRQAG